MCLPSQYIILKCLTFETERSFGNCPFFFQTNSFVSLFRGQPEARQTSSDSAINATNFYVVV